MVGAIFRKLSLGKGTDNQAGASNSSLTAAAAQATGQACFHDLPTTLVSANIIPLLPTNDLSSFKKACTLSHQAFNQAFPAKTASYPNPESTPGPSLSNETFGKSLKHVLKSKPSITELAFDFRENDITNHILDVFLDQTLPLAQIESLTIKNSSQLDSGTLGILLEAIQIKCPNFKHLNLYGCSKITYIPENIQRLTKLETLKLNYCKNIPHQQLGVIANLPKLKHLYLAGWEFNTLPPVVTQITTLETLNLNYCKNIPHQQLGVIANLPKLKHLYLAGWEFNTLPPVVTQITTLETLDLSSCSFTKLPENIQNLPLKKLYLNNCKNLTNIDSLIQKDSPLTNNLEELKFTYCEKLKLPDAIENLKQLKKINLHGCAQLTTLPQTFTQLKNLADLNLRRCNKLENLKFIEELHSLENLDLSLIGYSYCDPENTPNFENLTKLKTLNLENRSEFEQLPGLEKCTQLEELSIKDLDNLNFQEFFSRHQLTNLTKLDVSNINLETLYLQDETNTPFPSLKDLTLNQQNTQNTTDELPRWIFNSTTLEKLSITSINDIKSIPESLSNLKNLKTLNFNCLQGLSQLPACIASLSNLEKLSICRTTFKAIPNLSGMHNLKELKINNSEIQSTEFEYRFNEGYVPKHRSFADQLPEQCKVTFEHHAFTPAKIRQRGIYP